MAQPAANMLTSSPQFGHLFGAVMNVFEQREAERRLRKRAARARVRAGAKGHPGSQPGRYSDSSTSKRQTSLSAESGPRSACWR